MKDVGQPQIITLPINEDTYRDDVHSSIGPAIENILSYGQENIPDSKWEKWNLDNYNDVFGEIDPDITEPESDFYENGSYFEDWYLEDEDADEAIVIQGKSFMKDEDLRKGLSQLRNYCSNMTWRNTDKIDKIDSYHLVLALPAGIEDPKENFSEFEKGVEERVNYGETIGLHALAYTLDPDKQDYSKTCGLL